MINIVYQSPWRVGGSTAYVVHLYNILRPHARIIRVGARYEKNARPLGDYNVPYHIIDQNELRRLTKTEPVLLAAAHPKDDVYLPGMWAVFHDPNEFELYRHWDRVDPRRIICIRETGLRHFGKATFIPHPYVRRYENVHPPLHPELAVSVARVSSIKNSHWIMAANERLPPHKRVKMYGEPNRLWFHRAKLQEKYPHLELYGPFERYFHADAEICRRARFSIDLTVFEDDGGGSQYSFLAAMDAGSLPLISADWASYPGPAAQFGLPIEDEHDLYTFLNQHHNEAMRRTRVEQNWRYLNKVHDPTAIAAAYLKLLT
jgi:hypothetical protein